MEWLAKAQQRDGHWDATGGMYPVAMTAMSGMALLMEGSTLSDGKYSNHLRKAADWYETASNVMWVAWGWHAHAWALIALQFCLCVMNIRGAYKAESPTPDADAGALPVFFKRNFDGALQEIRVATQRLQ